MIYFQSCLARTNCLRTSVLLQTIFRAGIHKNKHSFTSAHVFELSSSINLFGFLSKVVTVTCFRIIIEAIDTVAVRSPLPWFYCALVKRCFTALFFALNLVML